MTTIERYIILCGTAYHLNGVPRQLSVIRGERILDRTIRLLRENGITDIMVTATDDAFYDPDIDVPVIGYDSSGDWVNCFYPSKAPACYIFGDVYFSEQAIKTIVETQTDGIQFFASAPPFASNYSKPYAEPFAFKVVDQEHFRNSIETVKDNKRKNLWNREPLAWELWQIIKNTKLNEIDYHNYISINDYTCDIDDEGDIIRMEEYLQ